jgi:hypothetical protein
MSVVSLSQWKQENQPHWSGPCVCLHCRHEWVGVGPIGDTHSLDCPSCGLPKGVVKHLFGPKTGDAVLTCKCGSEALIAYRRASDGLSVLRCMLCGTDQTDTLFNG